MSETIWVDFRAVKDRVSMQMALDHYGINWLRKSKSELRGKCPIHKGDGDRTFHVSLSKNAFNCFSCHKRGNVLDFVAAMEQCSVRDAALKLAQWFNLATDMAAGEPDSSPLASCAHKPSEKPADSGPVNPPLSFQLRIDSSHEYGKNRGLTAESINQFGLGVCLSKGTFAGRYVIPLHNDQGQLIGYTGRLLEDGEPKYLFPSADKGFHKSHLLFNLHRVLAAERPEQSVVVVEGFFDAMRVHQAGYPCVALLGAWVSPPQADLLARHFRHAILMLDGNDAGRQGAGDALNRLSRRLFVRVVDLPDGREPDSLSCEEIHDLLSPLIPQQATTR